jgi:endonuclease-3
MLSSQTKDPVTHLATQNLRHNLPIPGLKLESLLGATVEEIDECIKKVGFHTTKAANLKLMAEKVRDEHGGEVPEDLEKLLEFRGVGPKMAFIAMSSYGYNVSLKLL